MRQKSATLTRPAFEATVASRLAEAREQARLDVAVILASESDQPVLRALSMPTRELAVGVLLDALSPTPLTDDALGALVDALLVKTRKSISAP